MLKRKVYRLTEEGRKAGRARTWRSRRVPAHSLLIETEAHVDIVRGCLREYPMTCSTSGWRARGARFTSLEADRVEYDWIFPADAKARALVEEDTVRLDRDALEIGSRLRATGLYRRGAFDEPRRRREAARRTVVLVAR